MCCSRSPVLILADKQVIHPEAIFKLGSIIKLFIHFFSFADEWAQAISGGMWWWNPSSALCLSATQRHIAPPLTQLSQVSLICSRLLEHKGSETKHFPKHHPWNPHLDGVRAGKNYERTHNSHPVAGPIYPPNQTYLCLQQLFSSDDLMINNTSVRGRGKCRDEEDSFSSSTSLPERWLHVLHKKNNAAYYVLGNIRHHSGALLIYFSRSKINVRKSDVTWAL